MRAPLRYFSNLSFKSKILILTVIPIIVVSILIVSVSVIHITRLGERNLSEFRDHSLDQRKNELKGYTRLALSAFEEIYKNADADDMVAQERVKEMIRKLEFSKDGYFYVIDYAGTNRAHPRAPQLEGKNIWDLQDPNGKYLTRGLVNNAKLGDGFTEYQWNKPSKEAKGDKIPIDKISYTQPLDKWEWVYGTGLYVDDIDANVLALSQKIEKDIQNSIILTCLIALGFVLLIIAVVYKFTLNESRMADDQLQQLSRRRLQIQEEERKIVTSQLKNNIKTPLAVVHAKMQKIFSSTKNVPDSFMKMYGSIGDVLRNVNQFSDDIGVDVYDDESDLEAAVLALTNRFEKNHKIQIQTTVKLYGQKLAYNTKAATLSVLEESLRNIVNHANSKVVKIRLLVRGSEISLEVTDDGIGFDTKALRKGNGLGIADMRERLSTLRGQLLIHSQEGVGTIIKAKMPLIA
ncbi:MAG: cache domain-containing protein [Cellvibrionaceae bacterium]